MVERRLDWDTRIPTERESGIDYLVHLSGVGDAIWEDEWARALDARRRSWKQRGWAMYSVTLEPSDLRIERVPDQHFDVVRADLNDAVSQANSVPRA